MARPFHFKTFLNLSRALFPQWHFFDQVGSTFELLFRISNSTSWEKVSFDQKHSYIGIFINVSINEALAQFNVVEHFAHDIQELQFKDPTTKEVESLCTFSLLRSLLNVKLNDLSYKTELFQFKIVACRGFEKMDIYVSDWISAEPT
jgi:hypothetical protein